MKHHKPTVVLDAGGAVGSFAISPSQLNSDESDIDVLSDSEPQQAPGYAAASHCAGTSQCTATTPLLDDHYASDASPNITPYRPYRSGLCHKEAPKYMQYPNILGGYRAGGTYWDCIKSLFEWHTETINAWTMFLGAFSLMCASAAVCIHDKIPLKYTVVFAVYACNNWIHVLCSMGCHLFMPISHQIFARWRRFDICAIFFTSIMLTFCLGFFALPWRLTLASTAVTAVTAAIAIHQFWNTPDDHELDPAAHSFFVGMIVVCWYFPMGYTVFWEVFQQQLTMIGGTAVGALVCMFLGGYLYAKGLPEKLAPGRFDIIGSSHQLMHVGVISSFWCIFLFIFFSYRKFAGLPY